jgi:hypothetical protein
MAFPGPWRAALFAALCVPLATIPVGADPVPPPAAPVVAFLQDLQTLVVDYASHVNLTQNPLTLIEQNRAFFFDLKRLVEGYLLQGVCVAAGIPAFSAGPIVWNLNPVVDASREGAKLVYSVPGAGFSGNQFSQGVYTFSVHVRNILTTSCGLVSGI